MDINDLEPKLLDALPGRFDYHHLVPENLGPMFKFTLEFPGRFPAFFDRVQDLLLDFTVHNAYKNSKFYRHLYSNLSEDDFIDKERLKDFPLIFRQHVEEAQSDICSKSADYAFSSYTTGTTTNNPLILNRSVQEQHFISNFFSHIYNDGDNESTSKIRLVLIVSGLLNHGQLFQIPKKGLYTIPIIFPDESRLNLAVKLLRRSFRIEGEERFISCISGSAVNISRLTAYILHKGLYDVNAHIDSIQASGNFLTDHNAKWLRDFWNCQISNSFSFSEFFFSAVKCNQCDFFHFSPFGIAEVLEIKSNRRIDYGRGKLFVTGLYPFTQMTPFIRYFTGDMVEVKQTHCPRGTVGYLFLGRQKDSLVFKQKYDGYSFLAGGEIYNALDEIPDLNRPRSASLPGYCEAVGIKPIFWSENDPQNIIHLELRYPPVLYRERVKQLENIIKNNLISQCSWLEKMFGERLISLKFHPPGSFKGEASFCV